MSISLRLANITAFEEQIEEAEALSKELSHLSDPQYVPAVLAMFERNADEQDYGVFHTFADYLEHLDPSQEVGGSTVGALIADSVRRAPMWKTCEILGGFVTFDEQARALLEARTASSLSEGRRDSVRSGLRDVLGMADETLSAHLADQVRAALADWADGT